MCCMLIFKPQALGGHMLDQIAMPDEVRSWLSDEEMVGKEFNGLTISHVLAHGTTAITYIAHDKYFKEWVLKLVTVESYGEAPPCLEIARFSQDIDERYLVYPEESFDHKMKIGNLDMRFVAFRSRRVYGSPLRDYMKNGVVFDARMEILRFVRHTSIALSDLHKKGYYHGDFHAGNIIRREIGGHEPEVRYVVIDVSEAGRISDNPRGSIDDLTHLLDHVRSFVRSLTLRENRSSSDETVIGALTHLPQAEDLQSPLDLYSFLEDCLHVRAHTGDVLIKPFNAINAEHISNESLLAKLCFTQMPWVEKLTNSNNVVLFGPRGSGKTMVFRRLRTRTKIEAGLKNEVLDDNYIALYLPCEYIFHTRFGDLSDTDISSYKDAFLLFLNLASLYEMCTLFEVIPSELSHPLGPPLKAILALAKSEIGTLWQDLNLPESTSSFQELASYVEIAMRAIQTAIAFKREIDAHGSRDFLLLLVDSIHKYMKPLRDRRFIILLDDYTDERVPLSLQRELHSIVMQRSASLCFKVSAHMFGSLYTQPRPLELDEGRNFEPLNLGTSYIDRRRNLSTNPLIQILNERLANCPGFENSRIEEWLGTTHFPGGVTQARALYQAAQSANDVHDESQESENCFYYGVDTLVDLCSGDYSEMIQIVGRIFEEAGIDADTSPHVISPQIQDRVIRKVSEAHLARVRHISPDGDRLHDVLQSFGSLSRNLLISHALVKKGGSTQPHRAQPYRLLDIVVEEYTKARGRAHEMWTRLQHASILIGTGVSTSRRTTLADRATLRRIYCPAFRTTLRQSEKLTLGKEQFEFFMTDPAGFANVFLKNEAKRLNEPSLLENATVRVESDQAIRVELPPEGQQMQFQERVGEGWSSLVRSLPPIHRLSKHRSLKSHFDLFIGAVGFEDRALAVPTALADRQISVGEAALIEYDLNNGPNSRNRRPLARLMNTLTKGNAYIPISAPVSTRESHLPESLDDILSEMDHETIPSIALDCSCCSSVILAQLVVKLLSINCKLTLFYAEPLAYLPRRREWEQKKRNLLPRLGPLYARDVRYVALPPILQGVPHDELPLLQVLFPPEGTARTAGVLGSRDPSKRIWIFGEFRKKRDSHHTEIAQLHASPLMHHEDTWGLVSSFNYRDTLLALGALYEENWLRYRLAIMPHGSKMQTVAASLFHIARPVSLVFAMPKLRDIEISSGSGSVWVVELGLSSKLQTRLRQGLSYEPVERSHSRESLKKPPLELAPPNQ